MANDPAYLQVAVMSLLLVMGIVPASRIYAANSGRYRILFGYDKGHHQEPPVTTTTTKNPKWKGGWW